MEERSGASAPIQFGKFEVDLRSGELRKQGFKVKLQEQPFQVLVMLLEHPNEVVTREQLQRELWPEQTFVDFERGLNRAINKLREALADDAESPHFIETLPRRGYRFLVNVERGAILEAELAGKNGMAIVPPARPRIVSQQTVPAAATRHKLLSWAAVGVLVAAVGAISVSTVLRSRDHTPAQVVRPFLQLDIDTGPDDFSQPAISSDGRQILFVSKGSLALRRLDQSAITRLPGTDDGHLPFFSPDGKWAAFFAKEKLQKISVDGGVPMVLCDAPMAGGGSWGNDGRIILALKDGLAWVPQAGGTPKLLKQPTGNSGTEMHLWPRVLPDGKSVLFASVNGSSQGSLQILSLNDGKVRTLVDHSTQGRYLSAGYLVYQQQGALLAAPIDPARQELTGPAVPLTDGVPALDSSRGDFDVSATGTLVYRRSTEGANVISWLYASGKTEPLIRQPGNYIAPRLSPDGTRLAMAINQAGKQNIWVYHLARETWTRLTFDDKPELLPTWTPDGEFLAFRSGNTLAWTPVAEPWNILPA